MWRHMNPVFQVSDVERAVAWYQEVLGLTPTWTWEDRTVGMSIGDLELYLDRADKPSPSRVSVYVDDAEAAYEQYRAAGAVFAEGLETKPWGVRRFTVRDPDGNLIDVSHEVG
ncbi:MAG TPA: VOC family protein [Thermoleophilaceae bacterium]|jgi:catechol 2,3-dioxygenase-like lactoylglutathione lyase family enzyme|nr:VOC family protein [Thermoleophilaceae bacterium]